MEASKKSPAIEAVLTTFTGRDRPTCIKNAVCVYCDGAANIFRDDLSAQEYAISGMCQECQDSVFGEDEV